MHHVLETHPKMNEKVKPLHIHQISSAYLPRNSLRLASVVQSCAHSWSGNSPVSLGLVIVAMNSWFDTSLWTVTWWVVIPELEWTGSSLKCCLMRDPDFLRPRMSPSQGWTEKERKQGRRRSICSKELAKQAELGGAEERKQDLQSHWHEKERERTYSPLSYTQHASSHSPATETSETSHNV